MPAFRLAPPRHRVRLIGRPRLLDRLDEGLQCRCILVQAPAGYGKTVLVSQWREHLAKQRIATVWLTADRGDGPAGLVHWLRVALAQVGVVTAPSDKPVPQNASGTDESDIGAIADSLASLRSELVILLDDYHLAQSAQTDAVMARLIRTMPDTVRIVVATRCPPIFDLTALRARGQLAEIGPGKLRFDDHEAAALFGPSLPLPMVQALNHHVEGWPIALQLANLRVLGADDVAAVLHGFAGSAGAMAEYVESHILAGLPDDLQSFLIETSILDVIDAAAANAVRGRGDARTYLDMAGRMNVLIACADRDSGAFRHHRILADFLMARREDLAPGRLAALHRAAANWFEQQGDRVLAAHHARKSGDRDRHADRRLHPLTNRESQILKELSRGHSNKLISRHLDLSEDGIKFHLKNIYRKLGVNARVTALNVAREMNII